jgi:hypothetical protein
VGSDVSVEVGREIEVCVSVCVNLLVEVSLADGAVKGDRGVDVPANTNLLAVVGVSVTASLRANVDVPVDADLRGDVDVANCGINGDRGVDISANASLLADVDVSVDAHLRTNMDVANYGSVKGDSGLDIDDTTEIETRGGRADNVLIGNLVKLVVGYLDRRENYVDTVGDNVERVDAASGCLVELVVENLDGSKNSVGASGNETEWVDDGGIVVLVVVAGSFMEGVVKDLARRKNSISSCRKDAKDVKLARGVALRMRLGVRLGVRLRVTLRVRLGLT